MSLREMAMAPAPAVQRLYDVCKKAFTSLGVPSESQVQSVRTILGAYLLPAFNLFGRYYHW